MSDEQKPLTQQDYKNMIDFNLAQLRDLNNITNRIRYNMHKDYPETIRSQTKAQSLASRRNWALRTIRGLDGQLSILRRAAEEVQSVAVLEILVDMKYYLNLIEKRLIKGYDRELFILKREKEKQNELSKDK